MLTFTMIRTRYAAAWLIAVSTALSAHAEEAYIKNLPQGWQPIAAASTEADAGLAVAGKFQQSGNMDHAVLVQNGKGGPYGLAIVAGAPAAQPSVIVKTFNDIKANPPRLALVEPGRYQPVCHGEASCAPLVLTNQAISLCFGEASCEIVYFNGSAFREAFITD